MPRSSDDESPSDREPSRREAKAASRRTRRAFVSGTIGASFVTLAGCGGGGGPGVTETAEGAAAGDATTEGMATGTEMGTPTEGMTEGEMTTAEGEMGTTEGEMGEGAGGEAEEELPEGVSEEEFVSGPVPDAYLTATSQAGEVRDPDNLQTKEAVSFQEAADAEEEGFITPGPNCGNCAEYIPDVNGDGFGACAKVEGYIDPEDWCVLWESIDEGEAEVGEEEMMEDDEETTEGGTETAEGSS